MFASIHRAFPLVGLTVGLVVTAGWIGLIGYALIRLF
jgi:hypothetical protein